ncbi:MULTISPECIES: esterase/lipase family protein [Leptospira]|uniref:esterase/lipase family protein n=2 Tax=Leptospiraceae TaxID=170 RepID=UPI001EE83A0E|nr:MULTISPECIES: alpha/beta hydrolase [Leptospira]MCG6170157.1 alpha/beta hydrolase [Leptospira sanjuanensis]
MRQCLKSTYYKNTMTRNYLIILFLSLSIPLFAQKFEKAKNGKSFDCVILIHGFLRSSKQLKNMGDYLTDNNLLVFYVDYPSRSNTIQEVSKSYLSPIVQNNCISKFNKIHFVTHSAGGIVLRHFLKENKIKRLGRVVMLAPPNKGSEIADFLSGYNFVNTLLGPILMQLKTDNSSFVNNIGTPNFELGIIMGDSSNDPISSMIIPGDDDGKVSIENSKLNSMKEFLLVDRTHTFIMDGVEVQKATLQFIKTGTFK